MTSILYLDFETYSDKELKTVGTYEYAAHAEILLATWAVNDGPVQCWDATDPSNHMQYYELLGPVSEPDTVIIAHNAMFDRVVSNHHFTETRDTKRWQCTMAQALSHGLPGSLDELCEIYGLGADHAKIKDGRRLIQLFCKPRPKNSKIRRATRETHPEEWARFIEYAKQDIVAMREIHKKLPKWNYPREPELSHWHLDQVINDRGVMIDREMCHAVIRAIGEAKKDLADEAVEMTSGQLKSTNQRDVLMHYVFEEHGIHIDDLTKSQVTKMIDDPDMPEPVKDLLRNRQQMSSTSTAKYKALLNRANSDDRFRGGIQFAGAARTRRAGGRGFQPQNLPSRGLLDDHLIEEGIEAMKQGTEALIYPNVMHLASSAIRRSLIAAPGKKFCIADLSNIEGRMVAWYANEEWKLQAFRDFDAGTGHDLYNLAYSKAFNVPVESVTKEQRAIGKVMELMLGYAGGVGAFVTGAAGYGFDLEALSERIYDTLPRKQLDEAWNFLEWMKDKKGQRYGLTDKAFVTVDTLKRLWRLSNPATVRLWADTQAGCEHAVITGKPMTIGKLTFDKKGAWLRIRLASGRYLCYPHVQYAEGKGISYMGVNQYTRKWSRLRSYGGKFLENISQSTARDVLFDSMPRAEAAGFPIVLHVHDELVTETDQGKDVDELAGIMSAGEPWTEGLPLAAAGFESLRYKK